MSFSRALATVIAIAAIAACPPAFATKVTNVTTGVTYFYDDYEGLGNDVSHTAFPDSSGDYDPAALVAIGWLLKKLRVSSAR